MGWIAPPAYSDAELALDLAMLVLGTGKSSRLYRALVVEQQLATQVEAYVDGNELCSMIVVDALCTSGKTPEALELALEHEIDELGRRGRPQPSSTVRSGAGSSI